MLDYQIIEDPSDLPQGEYGTDLLKNSVLASRAFFTILKMGLTGFRTYYLVVYVHQCPAALVCINETEKRLAGLTFRFLMCGNPVVSADSAIFTRSDFSRREVLPIALEALEDIAKKRRASVVFLKEMSFQYNALFSPLFFKTPVEPVLGLSIRNWGSLEDYLASMKSKYRKRILDARNMLLDLGATIQAEHNLDDSLDELVTLFNSFVYSARPDIAPNTPRISKFVSWVTNFPRKRVTVMTRDVFQLLHKTFPSELDITTIRLKGRMIGMTMNLKDGPIFYSMYTAMERNDLTPYIYRTLLSAKVSNAITAGCTYMHFGRTGQVSKADCGAKELNEGCYGKVSPVWLNHLVLPIVSWINVRQPVFTPRNVFKTDEAPQSERQAAVPPVNVI